MCLLSYALILLIGSCQSDKALKVEITRSESGWFYIVPRDTIINSFKDGVKMNIDGVCYINSDSFDKLETIEVYKGSSDVTNLIWFLSKVNHEMFIDGKKIQYHLIKFYFPENENYECCLEQKKNGPDTYTRYSKREKEHREKLIREGKITFE